MTGASFGDESRLSTLLAAGADINAASYYGETALMRASINANIEAIQTLVNAHADLNAQDDDGDTALIIAARDGVPAAIEALIIAGAKLDITNNRGWTALMSAAYRGDINVVNELIHAGAAVNVASPQHVTATRAAAVNYAADCVKGLASAGGVPPKVDGKLIDVVDYDFKAVEIAAVIPNPDAPRKCPLQPGQVTAEWVPPSILPTPGTTTSHVVYVSSDVSPAPFTYSLPDGWKTPAIIMDGATDYLVGPYDEQIEIGLEPLYAYKVSEMSWAINASCDFNYDCVAGPWIAGAYAPPETSEPHPAWRRKLDLTRQGTWNLDFIKAGCPYVVAIKLKAPTSDPATYEECVDAVGTLMSTIHVQPRILLQQQPSPLAPGPAGDLLPTIHPAEPEETVTAPFTGKITLSLPAGRPLLDPSIHTGRPVGPSAVYGRRDA